MEELDEAFVVKDASGQKLGYFYFEEELARRSAVALTKDGEGSEAFSAHSTSFS
jgi:hypothetical protein